MTLQEKMLAVIADMNDQAAEREEVVEAIAIALLTRKNLFILGDPGQAKSFVINQFRLRITGARQYERLLTKQADEDQLFGRVDLASLIPGGVPQSVLEQDTQYRELRAHLEQALEIFQQQGGGQGTQESLQDACERLSVYAKALGLLHGGAPSVNTAGKIPESDIVMLDEIFKCNDGTLNSLLTAFNERKYTNEGCTYPIPTISFFAASNEIPDFNDPQERILAALYDRLDLKVITANIAERNNRLTMLKKKQSGGSGHIHASVTLEELQAMQREVAAIPVPDTINELADDILCALRENGIRVSDRKYLNYAPVAQAKAWLSGHAEVSSEDLLALKNYLWDEPKDCEGVETILRRMCVNPMQDKVNNIFSMALESQEEFEAAYNAPEKTSDGRKPLIKLRSELLRLYEMQQQLASSAQSPAETAQTDKLLADLEQISRKAHEAAGYTYTTLAQQAALNENWGSAA